jgi:hypothetical protein
MHNTVDIHDLPGWLDQIRGLSGSDEIVVTAGNAPIARLLPLQIEGATRSRLSNPFLGEFTDEDFRLAKEALASNQPRHSTEQVIAFLQANERE